MAEFVRINIAKRWSATEFAELMSQMQFLADAALFADVKFDGQSPLYFPFRRLRRRTAYFDPYLDVEDELKEEANLRRLAVQSVLRDYVPPIPNDLQVRKINYGSPGFADLAGVGKVMEQLRIFVTDITDRFLHKDDRAIARESAAQDLLAKKLKNAESLLKLGEKLGLDPEGKRILVSEILGADYFLEGKVISGQITSVETVEG